MKDTPAYGRTPLRSSIIRRLTRTQRVEHHSARPRDTTINHTTNPHQADIPRNIVTDHLVTQLDKMTVLMNLRAIHSQGISLTMSISSARRMLTYHSNYYRMLLQVRDIRTSQKRLHKSHKKEARRESHLVHISRNNTSLPKMTISSFVIHWYLFYLLTDGVHGVS